MPRYVPRAAAEALESRHLLAFPVGEEFRANAFTTGSQDFSRAAIDADGNFVLIWESADQDGDGTGIYGRRYNAAGVAQGGEFRVNTFTTGDQTAASIAMDADGDFVVSWMSFPQDGSYLGIYAQRYNAAGVAQGGEFRVNTYTTNAQVVPSVAMDDDGNFVIAWGSFGQDGDNYGVYARRYNAAGAAQGTEFRVNSATDGAQSAPAVAMDDDGNFVIVWHSSHATDDYEIFARRYNAAGAAQGSEFSVNTFTSANQVVASAAMSDSGSFVISWQSETQDGDGFGVYARRFNSSGAAQGTEFRVNGFTTGNQALSSVAMDADGEFVVAWQSYTQESGNSGVYARKYSASGSAQGGEFRVNTTTAGGQTQPTVVMNGDGDYLVTWESENQDGSSSGIYAQRFALPQLASGVLNIQGSAANDTITLAVQGANLVVTQNGQSANYTNASVTRIDIKSGEGNDRVTIGAGVIGTYVLGGGGNDVLVGGDGNDSLSGAAGKDTLTGNLGNDRLNGGKHSDVLAGSDGDDRLYGDEADDRLDGGFGKDRAYGGLGNDVILGGNHNDTIYGEAGNDSLDGGAHNDRLFPGPGQDTAFGAKGDDAITDTGDSLIDVLNGGAGDDTAGADGNDLLSQFEHS